MDAEKFIGNVRSLCALRNIAPKTACRESGAGDNFLTNVAHGSIPSVAKVQLLAQYLGVTTSELLGETPPGGVPLVPESDTLSEESLRLLTAYQQAAPELQAAVRRVLGLVE